MKTCEDGTQDQRVDQGRLQSRPHFHCRHPQELTRDKMLRVSHSMDLTVNSVRWMNREKRCTSTESEYFSQRSAGSLTVSPGWLPVPCQEQGGGPNPTNGPFCCSGSFCRKRKCSHLWQSMCEEQQSTSGWPRNWGRGMQEAPVPWAEAWPGLCPFCLAKIRHTISHFTASFYRPDKVLPSECQDEKNPDAWPAGVSSLTDRMKASRAGCRTGWCTGSKPSHAGDQPGHNPRLDGCSAGRDSAVDRMGGHYTAILLLNQRAELTFKND